MRLTISIHIIIVAMLILFSSCQWVDHQLEALTCLEEGKFVGDMWCEDRVIYECWLSLRVEKLFTCQDIENYQDDYETYLEYNLECCEE